MAPQVQQHPGTRPTEKGWLAVDKDILARNGHPVGADKEEHGKESTSCFYCLEGWVFLGSLDHDGQEILEAIRCRRCGATGWIAR